MFGKKRPILTATTCNQLENLRLALEVLTGLRVRIVDFDFNEGRGRILLGTDTEPKNISLIFISGERLDFAYGHELGKPKGWYHARVREQGLMHVISDFESSEFKRGPHSIWRVGRSHAERWIEPLYTRDVEYAASLEGKTVQEFLAKFE